MVQNCWESQQTSWSWLVGEVLSDEAEEYARLKFARWQWFHIIFNSEERLKQGARSLPLNNAWRLL